ncbi:hypothetical protein NT01EI_1533 [Edwardsiella ictaluri 93-146]|uniref:Uncharacterized protein n=1 Tax=Edwardsiella ictaluri (strain 93-146) TaxID=634503 RepID=C5B7Y3_EDWI9|nr:hypothetical protein NT01EI_1533 [Edwardsiella ictaluri 93-146]
MRPLGAGFPLHRIFLSLWCRVLIVFAIYWKCKNIFHIR